ncbi:hypothetical protein [Streptomyces sp. DH10]|uniref:hypothetical protein n=1 Tax=Streptomyces sp. DH10 TaxID=3040121 RepID=UPI002441EC05|nr:hypothetical protein [Streptomyces sp. DH10]MDG9709645.1 hypothetical protein [Streptomyces sp. DH10]
MNRWIIKGWRRWRRYVLPTPASVPGCVQGAPDIPRGFGFARPAAQLGGLSVAAYGLAAIWATHPVEVEVGVLAAILLYAATELSKAAYEALAAIWRAKRGEGRGRL